MAESEIRGFTKPKVNIKADLKAAKKQAFFAQPPLSGKPLCQKKQLENLSKPNLTIIKSVTPPRDNLTIIKIVTPPKKVYPPLQAGENLLETDLQISDSESEKESEKEKSSPVKPLNVDKQKIKKPLTSTDKWRLNPAIVEKYKCPTNRLPNNQSKLVPNRPLNIKRPSPFVWPKVDPPPKRVPSPTFARFNPGLVCPKPSTPQPTIVINNYYGYSANKPSPQCTNPAQMTRGQFKRFAKRKTTTQAQINEALAIRNALKRQ